MSRQVGETFLDTEECFRRSFEDAGSGMALVSLDGRWLRVNRALCEIVGYSKGELLAKTFQAITHPDDLESNLNRLHDFLAEKKLSYQVEKRYIHRDGHVVWVRVTASLIRDAKGSPRHLLSQIEDITARKRAEQALRESEERFRMLAVCAPLGIFLVDREGDVIYTNPKCEEITGLSQNDSLGEKWKKWLHADKREEVLSAWATAIQQGSDFHQEIHLQGPTGKSYWVQADMVPIRDPDGKVTSYVGTSTDITETKKLQQQLLEQNSALSIETERAHEANELKSRFLAHMSHELRTPLNGIIGFSELLYDQKPGPLNPQQSDFLNDVLHSAKHLLQLINDLLDLSKIEAGRLDLIPESFSFREVVAEVSSVIHPLIERKGLSYSVEINLEDDEVHLDRRKISQILYNLLSNAIKFTSPTGRIILCVKPHGNSIELTIRDTGMGIQPEDMERLFREFEQFETTHDGQRQGSGLGLMLTKKLVTLHQGTIHAESVLGQGSTFFVVLPRTISTRKSS